MSFNFNTGEAPVHRRKRLKLLPFESSQSLSGSEEPRILSGKPITKTIKSPSTYQVYLENVQPTHSVSKTTAILEYFDRNSCRGKSVLELGCRGGSLDIDIARIFGPECVLGIDVDPRLIKQARHHLNIQRSLTHFETMEHFYYPHSAFITFGHHHFVGEMKGPLGNISFQCADWLRYSSYSEKKFDVVIAIGVMQSLFSSSGQQGVKAFLKQSVENIASGGIFLVEVISFTPKKSDSIPQNQKSKNVDAFKDYLTTTLGLEKTEQLSNNIAVFKKI